MSSWWEKKYGRHIRMVRSEVMDHHISEVPSRSFHFATPSKGSIMSYTLTWTPGVLTLSGDLDEMVIDHPHALRAPIAAALDWASGDLDYLLSKSSAVRTFDMDETFQSIKRQVYESLEETIAHYRDDCYAARVEDEKHTWAFLSPKISDPAYERGFAFFDKVRKEFTWSSYDDMFTSAGRRRIWADVREFMEDVGPHSVAEALSACDFGDYYGTYTWPTHAITQVVAIVHGAKLAREYVLREMEQERLKEIARVTQRWYDLGMPMEGEEFQKFQTAMGQRNAKEVETGSR